MLTERGRVVAIDGDSVWVETLRQRSCDSCSARAGCGHGMLNSALPGSSRGLVRALLPPDRDLAVSLHDQVEISLPERGFLQGAALLYAMPIAATVGGAMLAQQYLVGAASSQSSADLMVALGAVLGLGAGLLLLKWRSRAADANPALVPRVTARN